MRKVILIQIIGNPVPWAAPRICKKVHYSPKAKELQDAIIQIRAQYSGKAIESAIRVDFDFYFPIPASASKKDQREMLSGDIDHIKKPDRSNCLKFYEDALEKAGVISNDSIIVTGIATKHYSGYPKTLIMIQVMKEVDN